MTYSFNMWNIHGRNSTREVNLTILFGTFLYTNFCNWIVRKFEWNILSHEINDMNGCDRKFSFSHSTICIFLCFLNNSLNEYLIWSLTIYKKKSWYLRLIPGVYDRSQTTLYESNNYVNKM